MLSDELHRLRKEARRVGHVVVSEEDLRKVLLYWEGHIRNAIRNAMWKSNLDYWKSQDEKCNALWGLLNNE